MYNTVIFWTELSCQRKNYSSKVTLLLALSHRYKNSTSRPGWPFWNIHISNDYGSFTFYAFFFLSLVICKARISCKNTGSILHLNLMLNTGRVGFWWRCYVLFSVRKIKKTSTRMFIYFVLSFSWSRNITHTVYCLWWFTRVILLKSENILNIWNELHFVWDSKNVWD